MKKLLLAMSDLGHIFLFLVSPVVEIVIIFAAVAIPAVAGHYIYHSQPEWYAVITIALAVISIVFAGMSLKWVRANGRDWEGPV